DPEAVPRLLQGAPDDGLAPRVHDGRGAAGGHRVVPGAAEPPRRARQPGGPDRRAVTAAAPAPPARTPAARAGGLARAAAWLALAALLHAIALATILCAAAAVPARALEGAAPALAPLLGATPDDDRVRLDRAALATAAWVVLACALLAALSYERHPHVPDEVS